MNAPDWMAGDEGPAGPWAFAARHLAIGCALLARANDNDAATTARLRAAESRFRALADADPTWRSRALAATPIVRLADGGVVPLIVLFEVGRGALLRPPGGGSDPDLVDGACELLLELVWDLPPDAPLPH